MRLTRARPAIYGLVSLVSAALLVMTPGSSSAGGPTNGPERPGHGCPVDHDGDHDGDRDGQRDHEDRDRSAPADGVLPTTQTDDANLSATIRYVTFGSRLHRRHIPTAGRVLELRLDVIAAAGTRDPDLRLDVDGARLLSCPRLDLTPGRVTHLTLAVWVPRSAAGRTVRVTASVRIRPHPKGAVLRFRHTYLVAICDRTARRTVC
jgi:hypothetical protein